MGELGSLSDEELVRRLRESGGDALDAGSGNREISKVLYDRYYKQCCSFCRYYGLSYNDTEDTVQEAFISLFRNCQTFQDGRVFKPWFLKILLNHVRKRYNRLKKDRYNSLDPRDDDDDDTPVPDTSDKNSYETLQNRLHFQDILNRMPEKFREVIIMKMYQELDFEEISALTGIKPRQVRNRLDQALTLFRELLEEESG